MNTSTQLGIAEGYVAGMTTPTQTMDDSTAALWALIIWLCLGAIFFKWFYRDKSQQDR